MDTSEAGLKILQFALDGSSVDKPNSEERIKTYFSYLKEIQEKILKSESIFRVVECDPNQPDYRECLARNQKLRERIVNFSMISTPSNVLTGMSIKEKIDILLKEYDEICKQMDTASEFFKVSE
ncbi:hypothetical protein LC605_28590 [Nostoc sp. CHAB 5836]|uniref:hypothetical protein n=1 Tax=Nostoc sp. CHAB 5836 TaxID=2780404 RepID=UPI001E2D0B1E|nr:hypothetical protein [Nostoc sp. CHAB 5836]MCC5618971.1 hypothetical protein [Nostoc sp. CHAB 5836]